MNCSRCLDPPTHYCHCDGTILCQNHYNEHLRNTNVTHVSEFIDFLSTKELKKIKSSFSKQIMLIESAKSNINLEVKNAILNLENYAEKEIRKLDDIIKKFSFNMKLTRLSKAQKEKIYELIEFPYKISNIKLKINIPDEAPYSEHALNNLENFNNLDLINKKKKIKSLTSLDFDFADQLLISNNKDHLFSCNIY